MKQPLVSFIVPVYKAEQYIEQCIKSILYQNFSEWELILVDDESPDKSGEICEKFAQKDNRIHVIHRKNGGQGAARNTGASLAIGKWIMFVDDDDWLDQNMYTECAQYLTEDVDILTFCKRDVYRSVSKDRKIGLTSGALIFENKEDLRTLQVAVLNSYAPLSNYKLNKVMFGVPWGKFIRRMFWIDNKLTFIEGSSEDQPCFLRAYGCVRKVVHIDNCYYNYRVYESTVRKYLKNAYDSYDKSLSIIHKYVEDNLSEFNDCIEALYHADIAYFSHYVVQDYCHRLNKQSYKQKKKRFNEDFQKRKFRESFNKADLRCLPLRRHTLALLIRNQNFFLLNVMCRMNDIWNYFIYTHY